MKSKLINKQKLVFYFFSVVALMSLAGAFSDVIMSNFFREVYNVGALGRGFIEVPRETPGIISIFAISLLSFLFIYMIINIY